MPAFLLTWNPERWQWTDRISLTERVQAGELTIPMQWSAGNTRDIPPQSRLFLLKQGREPRGIMASGWSTGPVVPGPHWDGERAAAGQDAFFVPLVFDTLLNPDVDPLLTPEHFPSGPANEVYWRPMASGTSLPDAAAQQVDRLWAEHLGGADLPVAPDYEARAYEGTIRERFIRYRSRERRLRSAKLAAVQAESGALRCEVPGCGFDFSETYGALGEGFAHVHHRRPLASDEGESLTTLADLAIVCANCHAMIHHRGRCLALEDVRPRTREA